MVIEAASVNKPRSLILGELNAWNIDNEVALITFREELAQLIFRFGDFGMEMNLAVQHCEIEDMLISTTSEERRCLARSFIPNGALIL